MRNLILVAMLFAIVASCGPASKQRRAERKLAKLVKENPSLVKHDTIFKDTTLKSAEVHELFQAEIGPDLWPVDSLTGYFQGKVDSSDLDSLNQGFKAILERSGDIDTTFMSKNSRVHVKKRGKKLEVAIDVVPDPIKFKSPTVVNSIHPNAALTWYEDAFLYVGRTFGALGFAFMILLLFLLLCAIIRYVSK